jgi:2Fe-2S ferredoxin
MMAQLRIIDRDGVEHVIDAAPDGTIMEILRARDHGVAAICGGMCSCATCHVYVDSAWESRLPAPMADERELLAELAHHTSASRLSCQVTFKDDLSGLTLRIAPEE